MVPSRASTDTVNAVLRRAVLSRTIIGSCSSSSRWAVRGTQTMPLE